MQSDTITDITPCNKAGMFEFSVEVKRGITISTPKGDIEDVGGRVDVVLDAGNVKTLRDVLDEVSLDHINGPVGCSECGSFAPLNEIEIGKKHVSLCDDCVWNFEEVLLGKLPHPLFLWSRINFNQADTPHPQREGQSSGKVKP